MAEFALVFPGQGSQAVGMGRELSESQAAARLVFDEADATLGYSLSRLCFFGPAELLQKTEYAQPALLTVETGALAVLRERIDPLSPVAVAGHSLGEFTALVAAGAIDFAAALRLVAERGRLMNVASETCPGTMLAILGLDERQVADVCAAASGHGRIALANQNSPGQSVLSGDRAAIDAAARYAREAGARRAIALPVSGAFHSPLMQPAADEFAASLATVEIRAPQCPIIANTTGLPLRDVASIRAELGQQLTGPVKWSAGVRTLHELGARTFVELGPGTVLSGLIKRTAPGAEAVSAGDSAGIAAAAGLILESSR
jgi:[acyl-carrier-protein] S-malonyltransferase